MATTPSSGKILDGFTVVDLTSYLAGPFASLMLANQGAEIIKIERPGTGDEMRLSPPYASADGYDGPGRIPAEEGESHFFQTVNYGKKSVEIDLQTDEGLAAVYDLVSDADVLLHNFRPGTADRIGVGYDDIRDRNEEIIYCSISGFGESGPWSSRPGLDLIVQGTSGIMSVTGHEDGPPAKAGVSVADLATPMWAAFGIVGALLRRELTGEGDYIELGMHDSVIPWLTDHAAQAFAGETPQRLGTRSPNAAPYQAFPTADGYINVACPNKKLWRQLCEAIDRPELADDPRFATNADRIKNLDELETELSTEFQKQPTEHWVELLTEDLGLPVGPIYTVPEALENEHTEARGVIREMDHPAAGTMPVIEHPLNFQNAEAGFDSGAPVLGADTESVLRDHGYDDEDIALLRDADAIS